MEKKLRFAGRIALAAVVFLACMGICGEGRAFIKGDIDNDGLIGLPEAIYALGMASGLRTPQAITTINVPADVGTIQGAIDAASPGDVINVASGNYAENLVITKNSIFIDGAGAETTIIDGGGSGVVIDIRHAKNTVIRGLKITNGEFGIVAMHANLSLSATLIEANTSTGVRIVNGSLSMSGDQVKNNQQWGIRVLNSSSASITNTTISHNTLEGVRVDGTSTITVQQSVLSNNSGSGIAVRRGSFLYFMANSVAENNGRNGVDVNWSSSAFIGDVVISGNGYAGIMIGGGSNAHIQPQGDRPEATLITDNGGSVSWGPGIGIDGNSSCTIHGGNRGVSVSGNRNNGFNVGAGGMLEIRGGQSGGGVSVSGNGNDGISVFRGGVLEIRGGSGEQPVSIAGNGIATGGNGISLGMRSVAHIQGDAVNITGNGGFGGSYDCDDQSVYTYAATINYGVEGADPPGGLNVLGAVNCVW